MINKDLNRICELSGVLLEDIRNRNEDKIVDIIKDKIQLPYKVALSIVELANGKKPIALWIANTYKDSLLNDRMLNREGRLSPIPTGNYMLIRRYFGVLAGNPKKYIDYNPFETGTVRLGTFSVGGDDTLISALDDLLYSTFEKAMKEHYVSILDWWNYYAQPGRTQINLKDYNFKTALEASKKWHEELETKKREGKLEGEKERAIILFPDGSYWLDLETNYSEEECEMMGHCGRSDADTLISYRDKEGQSHLTMAYSEKSKIIDDMMSEISDDTINIYHQLKGVKNSKPKEEYHEKIVALFQKLDINDYQTEYSSEVDFHVFDLNDKLLKKLLTSNKDLYNNLPLSDKLKLYKRVNYKNPLYSAKTDEYTKFAKDGVKLIVDDWETLSDLFDKDHEKIATEVFGGDLYQYYNYSEMNIELNYAWDDINDNLINEIKKLLINTNHEDKKLTLKDIETLDLKEFIDAPENNMAEEIKDKIEMSYVRAYESAIMDSVYKIYKKQLTDLLGEPEYIDDKFVFTISYDEFSEWLDRYMETGYEEELSEPISIYNIIRNTLAEEDELLSVPEENRYEGGYGIDDNNFKKYFNEDLSEQLGEIDEISFKESKEQQFLPGMREEFLDRIKDLSGIS